jgi:hypothetical protein
MTDEWTPETIRLFLQREIDDFRVSVDRQFCNADKAILKAELAGDKRFDSISLAIGQLTETVRGLINRAEVVTLITGANGHADTLAAQLSAIQASASTRLLEVEKRTASRFDQADGRLGAIEDRRTAARFSIAQIISGLTLMVFLISVSVAVVVAYSTLAK